MIASASASPEPLRRLEEPVRRPIPQAIAAGLARVRARIAAAARAAGRAPDDVTLVAVSKTHPPAAIAAALAAGQTVFGENRVQEAAAKFPPLVAAHPALRLHLIGALQTNKARDAVRIAHAIESLDRPRLAEAIAEAAEREGRLPDLYVQVNVGDEPQKAGVSRAEADAFIRACRARFGAALRGLMCIPPAAADPAPHFAWLAACAAAHGLAGIVDGDVGRFRDRDRVRGDAGAGGKCDLRRAEWPGGGVNGDGWLGPGIFPLRTCSMRLVSPLSGASRKPPCSPC